MTRICRSSWIRALAWIPCALIGSLVAAQGGIGAAPIDQGRLHYRVVGSGEPLVIVHGGPNLDHRYLFHGLESLAKSHRLTFYDQRAVGSSHSRLSPELFGVDRAVEDLEALRARLDLPRFRLLGHSWGGFVAMAYAAEHPEKVQALIVVSPMEPGRRYAERLRQTMTARLSSEDKDALAAIRASEAFRQGDVEATEEALRLGFLVGVADRSVAETMLLDLHPRTAANGPQVVQWTFRDPTTIDLWDRLSRIQAPTLVIHGRRDAIPEQMVEELAATIPAAELVILDDAGHFPYLESPKQFFGLVNRFLESVGLGVAAEAESVRSDASNPDQTKENP